MRPIIWLWLGFSDGLCTMRPVGIESALDPAVGAWSPGWSDCLRHMDISATTKGGGIHLDCR